MTDAQEHCWFPTTGEKTHPKKNPLLLLKEFMGSGAGLPEITGVSGGGRGMGEGEFLKVTNPVVTGGCNHYKFNVISTFSGVILLLYSTQRAAASHVTHAGMRRSQGLLRGRLLAHAVSWPHKDAWCPQFRLTPKYGKAHQPESEGAAGCARTSVCLYTWRRGGGGRVPVHAVKGRTAEVGLSHDIALQICGVKITNQNLTQQIDEQFLKDTKVQLLC